MVRQGNGSIVTLSASLTDGNFGYMAGITAACGAIEAMTRSLAGEFGPAHVRVNCVRATAMPETRTIRETTAGVARIVGIPVEAATPAFGPQRRPLTVRETATAAAFLASDAASGITGQIVNVYG